MYSVFSPYIFFKFPYLSNYFKRANLKNRFFIAFCANSREEIIYAGMDISGNPRSVVCFVLNIGMLDRK